MQLGRCCRCAGKARAVTLKGIDITDGTTVWNYGPGSFWRHHYGLDAISGLVPNLSATLDKYIIAAESGTSAASSGLRSGAGLAANAVEALTITKLDSTDGTVIESATLEGVFANLVNAYGYSFINGHVITDAAALSGGDYVAVCKRVPVIEFDSFTSNTASKTYILHAHSQREGNVLVRTRTSDELITIPWNSSAAAVETLFEATADCTAATVSGGPWPLRKIQVDVTWSVSSGDIKSIATSGTYTAGGGVGTGSCSWTWDAMFSTWNATDLCTTGSPGGMPTRSGAYDGETVAGVCTITGTTTRSVDGTAVSYSTSTGLMQSAVGYEFGRNDTVTPAKLLVKTGTLPTWTAAATLKPLAMAAADNDVVVVIPVADQTEASSTVEAWTVADPWIQNWQKWTNTATARGRVGVLNVQANTACVSFPKITATGGARAAATIDVATETITEYEQTVVSASTANTNNSAESYLSDGSATEMTVVEYDLAYRDAAYPNIGFQNHFEGSEVCIDGDEWLFGTSVLQQGGSSNSAIGTDSTQFYAVSYPGTAGVNYGPPERTPPVEANDSREYYWWFYLPLHTIYETGTQWRFRFQGSSSTQYTSWLNWYCTGGDIEAAVIATFGENTGGVVSNAEAFPFGVPSSIGNANFSPLEQGLDIIFRAAGNANGVALGYIPAGFTSLNRVTIEFQNISQPNILGFGAWSRTDGSIVWQRTFGSTASPAKTYATPRQGWLKGAFLYVAGDLVDAEV